MKNLIVLLEYENVWSQGWTVSEVRELLKALEGLLGNAQGALTWTPERILLGRIGKFLEIPIENPKQLLPGNLPYSEKASSREQVDTYEHFRGVLKELVNGGTEGKIPLIKLAIAVCKNLLSDQKERVKARSYGIFDRENWNGLSKYGV